MGSKLWNTIERAIYYCLVKVLHFKFFEKRWIEFIQFVKFGLVGLSNTLVSYIVYLFGITLGIHYLVASILGFIISVINSFYWNNLYVFKEKKGEHRNKWKSFAKTFMAYAGTGLILNNILLYFQINLLQWSEIVAPLINLLVTIPLNFIINKLWAFKSEKM